MRNKILTILLLLIISFVSHPIWIVCLATLTHGDWLYQTTATSRELFVPPMMWTTASMGGINIGGSFYPFEFAIGLLAKLNLSFGLIERMIFMWPILIIGPISSYLFLKKIFNNSPGAFIGSFVYCYNTYFLIVGTGQLTLMVAYSFAPLVVLLFIKTLEKKQLKDTILTSIFSFIVSFYEFRVFYILCTILFFYYLFHVFVIEKVNKVNNLIKVSIFAAVPILIVFLLNLYWILGFAKIGALTSNSIFDRTLFGDEFLNINYAITLFHPFWTGVESAIFVVQSIPIYFWLIPVFAFLGLTLNNNNKKVVFFGLVAILGIFLTKQVAHPFMDIYPWLYKYFPGFNAFREASKFYFLIALGYSVLIAGFIDWLWKNWKIKKWQIYGKYVLTVVIVIIFLWNLRPAITSEFNTIFVPREIPKDYLLLNNFIFKQKDFSRILWIPINSRWGIYLNNHPKINAVDMINSVWNKFIKNKRNDRITEGELVMDSLINSRAENLLSQSSIKYVIVPLKDNVNDDDFFINYGKSRWYYINELNKISYLHKINIGMKDIDIYVNYNYRPHIYITREIETISKDLKYKTLNYKFISPVQYSISISNIKDPFYLNFSETYHSNWKLRIGNFSWMKVLNGNNYFINDKFKFQNDAMLNSFFIDPSVVCKEFNCIRNKDGSYDINLTLYFIPQSYIYFGFIISVSALIIILSYLIYIFGKYLYERNS